MGTVGTRSSVRSGHTLLELVIAASLIAGSVLATSWMLAQARSAYQSMSSSASTEVEASRNFERILVAMRDASEASVDPKPSPPFSSPVVTFQTSTGDVGGTSFLSFPERIEFTPGTGDVVWTRSIGQPDESSVVLTRAVPDFLDGESAAIADENGNGLVNERGLCFTFEDGLLVVRLTLARPAQGGTTTTKTLEGRVEFRH